MYDQAPKGIKQSSWDTMLGSHGLVVITVHGTFAADVADEGSRWWQQGSFFLQRIANELLESSGHSVVLPFHWTGNNSDYDRFEAARRLRTVMLRLSRAGRTYAILGHSHAGNIVYSAFRYFCPSFWRQESANLPVSIITFGTPFLSRKSTLLSWLKFIANAGAFVYSIPILLMLFLALPATFGWFGWGLPSGKIGIVPERVLVSVLIPIFILTIYISWKYGVSYILAGILFRKRKKLIGERWLCIRSTFDEAISIMPSVASQKYDVVSKAASRRAASRLVQSFSLIVIGIFLIIFMGFALLDIVNSDELSPSYNKIERSAISMAYFVLASNIYLVIYLATLVLAPLLGLIYRIIVNNGVRNALISSAFGQDHDHKIRNSGATPPDLQIKEYVTLSPELGGVTIEKRRDASIALLEFVVAGQGAQSMAIDPLEALNDLTAALFHSAYFEDKKVIEETTRHLSTHFNYP